MREKRNGIPVALLVLSGIGLCQDTSSTLNARALFYREQQDSDKLPAVPGKSARTRKTATASSDKSAAVQRLQEPLPVATRQDEPSRAPIVPAVQHLGLRYNILLVDAQGRTTFADPDGNFHRDDCIQIEFFPNRSGYLYVVEQGSSKSWQPLLPSPNMPEEANIVRSYTTVRVPQNYCFTIDDPPGDERLFIVLSRNPEDIHDLHEAIKNDSGGQPAPAAPAAAPSVITADNRLDDAIRRVSELQSRDIKIKKISHPENSEPPESVYVTNASDTASDRLVLQIQIKHR